MEKIRQTADLGIALGFVLSLLTVGVFSHTRIGSFTPEGSILSGQKQSRYEDEFSDANPIRQHAVNFWGALKYGIFGQAAAGAIVGADGWLFTSEEFQISPKFDQNLQSSLGEMIRVNALLKRRNVQLLIVLVPDKSGIYSEKLSSQRPIPVQSRYDTLTAGLHVNNVGFVDARAVLIAAKAIGDSFMPGDTHWSPLGAAAVAQAVADAADKSELSANAVHIVLSEEKPFEGDLHRYVPTGIAKRLIGPRTSQLQTFETTVEAHTGLFGEAVIDVVLIGTSYSAQHQWHFDGFLKAALGTDVLNLAKQGLGPFVPMQQYLESESLANNPPKLVVWEIPERYTTLEATK